MEWGSTRCGTLSAVSLSGASTPSSRLPLPFASRKTSAGAGRQGALSPAAIVFALAAVGAAMRFGTIDVQSAWLDESSTIHLVRRGLTGMLSHLWSEETPPLYFVLVWAWTKVFGVGVLAFRSFSAVIGTLTIPVMYAAGRRISPRVGLWAAALTTFNPAMYYYSQEARGYAMLIFFAAAAFFFWLRVLQKGDGRSLSLWSAMSVLALLTHYYAIFMFIPEAAILLRRLGVRRLLAPVAAVALTGIALIPLALWQHSTYATESTGGESTASRAAGAVKQFLVGLYGPLEIYSALAVGVIAALAFARLLRGEEPMRRLALQMAVVGGAAYLLPLVLPLAHVAGSSFEGRHLISAWVPFALLVAMGLGAAGDRRVGVLLGLALCTISIAVIAGINALPGYQREDWRGVGATLASHPGPAEIVVPEEGLGPLSIYLPGLRKVLAPRTTTRELEFVAIRTKRTGRSPLAPAVFTTLPAGYRLISVKRTETYAVSFLLAPRSGIPRARLPALQPGGGTEEVLLRG
jgi:mannosyltransferase